MVIVHVLVAVFLLILAAILVSLVRKHLQMKGSECQISELRAIPCLGSQRADRLAEICPFFERVEQPKGSCVIREHHHDDSLFCIVYGSINIVKSGSVHNSLIKELGPGEFFGEMAFLTGSKRIASAEVVEDACLLRIEKRHYERAISVVPELDAAIWDACDRHSIELCMSDHEDLRRLSLEERQDWIASRKIVISGPGDIAGHEGSAWLSLVKGRVQYCHQEYEAPSLIRVDNPLDAIAESDVRLCWLPAGTLK